MDSSLRQTKPTNPTTFTTSMWFRLFTILLLSNLAVPQSKIRSLPGFPGDIPFKLETGYVGVGERDDVQLFYYFVESDGYPRDDPLLLWLSGGPGCSSLSGLIYEIGPFTFNYSNFSGNFPSLVLNPYSWTKVSNIIFLDLPVGAGFSYAKTSEGYNTGDLQAVANAYDFLRKWFLNHPEYLSNQLYIGGDSYEGFIVPILTLKIAEGNKVGMDRQMNLQGYVLGNPFTDKYIDKNARVPFAHRLAILSDELYDSTKKNCDGDYIHVDPLNAPCIANLLNVSQCMNAVNLEHVLEPQCQTTYSPKPNLLKWDIPAAFEDDDVMNLLRMPSLPKLWCREYNRLLIKLWANDEKVQDALHVRKGTKEEWMRCNRSMHYSFQISSTVEYHRNLTKEVNRALIYSGDHDMTFSHIGTEEWIRSLNLSMAGSWRPWFVNGQSAGFTMTYQNKKFTLTYATVKGGGHEAPEYKPQECFAMAYRWFAAYPL